MREERAGSSVALNLDGSVLAFSSSGNYGTPRGQELSGNPSSLFGSALQISRTGTILVASAPVIGTVVVVYQYKNETSSWEQLGDTLQGATIHDIFGSSLALFEETGIMISAPKDDESGGPVQPTSSRWTSIPHGARSGL